MNKILQTDSLYEFLRRMTREERKDACKYPEFFEACRKLGLDVYNEKDILGQGAYGQVFRSHRKGVDYAFKKFRDLDESSIVEISILSLMSRIDAKHCLGSTNLKMEDTIGVVLPLATGDLRRWIFKNKEFAKENSTEIILLMSAGVEELHSCDIIHKDIKPDNFLVFQQGESFNIKLADFGISSPFPLQLGDLAYTVPYRSSKVFLKNEVNKKSDVWALGISCLDVLNGGNYIFDITKEYKNTSERIENILPTVNKHLQKLDGPLKIYIRGMFTGNLIFTKKTIVERNWKPLTVNKQRIIKIIKQIEDQTEDHRHSTKLLAVDILCRYLAVSDLNMTNAASLLSSCVYLAECFCEYQAEFSNNNVKEIIEKLHGVIYLPGLAEVVDYFENVKIADIWVPDFNKVVEAAKEEHAYSLK